MALHQTHLGAYFKNIFFLPWNCIIIRLLLNIFFIALYISQKHQIWKPKFWLPNLVLYQTDNGVHYGLMVVFFVCTLHYFIIIMQMYLKVVNFQNANKIYSVECLSKIKVSSLNYLSCNIWDYVCSVYSFLLCWLWEYVCTFSYHHHQIGSMAHLPLFKVRSWNNGMCCMSFYIVMDQWWPSTNAFSVIRPLWVKLLIWWSHVM